MPTSEVVDVDDEAPGFGFLPGSQSPISGKPFVRVDMDVVVATVKSGADYDEETDDTSFVRKVGDYLAAVLLLKSVVALEREHGDLTIAHKIVTKEVTSRPASETYPYSGALRFVGEYMDVLLVGGQGTRWLINGKGTGFNRFFTSPRTHDSLKIPNRMWKLLMFCPHKECVDPGCPCLCHKDGRNIVLETPLDTYGSDTADDLLYKWCATVEMVAYLLYEKANSDGRQMENYLGQVQGIEEAFEWINEEVYDPSDPEWVYRSALTVNMYHLLKEFVVF